MEASLLPNKNKIRTVSVLGSTGSIGCNTLDLVARYPDHYRVMALTANRNVSELAEQAIRFNAKMAVVADESCYQALKEALAGTNIKVGAGREALIEAASLPSDWVMASIVGAAGLDPTLSAIRRGAIVALANKECLVCAGDLVMKEVVEHNATLLPVDSEHNAIFQVFDFEQPEKISHVTLTASGGPFYQMSVEEMEKVTPQQAVSHPNWDMGAKISVDSATMMNKGLELIEAYHLFPVSEDKIEIIVHPQSVIHSMVSYVDGSVLAQLGSPDMRTPISYTLAWPERIGTPAKQLDLARLGRLDFFEPDPVRFPALKLAREALQTGGSAPTILNAANEIAVHAFLEGKIGFLEISRIVEKTLGVMGSVELKCLQTVLEIDREARRISAGFIGN
ncbi:1-deoxy-D-xylulose-5-phosphate reductoisomerase [Emcibacter nanhaiensis]|uniref:1-deoxy-D-xylulose 5-phosphate reductoisomerase n=1 Tax=Emcibacter nanhaiensis TaxID=1505037 RepID=A0A501PT74_9PROT|nr:1-deoxy-D-xylulose-5-phosphate reductoisomerase [Emcibacter nanhaiensis]TPD62911.1 1-deoxy-D-xylulose-5-phosphate reductoisomerase [Emcibacter nanhaiensis]